MNKILVFVFALFFLAGAAEAINTTKYPETLLDSTCTDSYSVIGGQGVGSTFVETSGTANGKCDHDNRILTGAQTADVTFGPFNFPSGVMRGIVLLVDADVVSNDTDTWTFAVQGYKPHDGAVYALNQISNQSTEGNRLIAFGNATTETPGVAIAPVAFPPVFAIKLDLVSATSWAGDISWRFY